MLRALCGFPEYIYVLYIEKKSAAEPSPVFCGFEVVRKQPVHCANTKKTSVCKTLNDKTNSKPFFYILKDFLVFNNNEKPLIILILGVIAHSHV